MINYKFEIFIMHLRYMTLKRFSLSNAQYHAQKMQAFKPATDLNDHRTLLCIYKRHVEITNSKA